MMLDGKRQDLEPRRRGELLPRWREARHAAEAGLAGGMPLAAEAASGQVPDRLAGAIPEVFGD